jgi:hypothetical protein
MSQYYFEAFACLEFVALESRQLSLVGRSRSGFCSCCFYLYVDEDVPHSGDADKGYQWEVQTDEDWVPYWESQA